MRLSAISAALVAALVGIAGALAQAMHDPQPRFAAVLTFAVTASGMTVLGIGAAFWGAAGGTDRARARSSDGHLTAKLRA